MSQIIETYRFNPGLKINENDGIIESFVPNVIPVY